MAVAELPQPEGAQNGTAMGFEWLCKGVLMEHHLSMGIFYGVVLFGCLLMGMSMVITSLSWDMTPVTMVVHLGIEKHVDIGLGTRG